MFDKFVETTILLPAVQFIDEVVLLLAPATRICLVPSAVSAPLNMLPVELSVITPVEAT